MPDLEAQANGQRQHNLQNHFAKLQTNVMASMALQEDVAWRPDAILGRPVELAANNSPFVKTCAATTIADFADRLRRYRGGEGIADAGRRLIAHQNRTLQNASKRLQRLAWVALEHPPARSPTRYSALHVPRPIGVDPIGISAGKAFICLASLTRAGDLRLPQ